MTSPIILPPHGQKRDVQIAISMLPNGSLRLAFDAKVDFVDLSPDQLKRFAQIVSELALLQGVRNHI